MASSTNPHFSDEEQAKKENNFFWIKRKLKLKLNYYPKIVYFG